MKTIYFVRHGESEWNAISRMQGQWNSDLSALGRRQAEASGRLLADKGVQALFVSPLDRTRQTAAIVARHVDAPVSYDDRLKEWDAGAWSGHLYSEIMERWPDEWAALRADPFHRRAPGGENYPDMIDRAKPFVDELRTGDANVVAVISHGMIGKVMISILAALDEHETLSIHQPNDVVFRVSLGPDAADIEHYRGGHGPFPGTTLLPEGELTPTP